MRRALELKISEPEKEILIGVIKTKAKLTKPAVRDMFRAEEAKYVFETAPSPELLALEEEQKRKDEEVQLWSVVRSLATDPKLLRRICQFAEEQGVVGEKLAVVAILLTLVSRLNRKECLRTLRRGAASSGKSFLIETMLKMLSEKSRLPARRRICQGLHLPGRTGRLQKQSHLCDGNGSSRCR